jgi:hypothetical protein
MLVTVGMRRGIPVCKIVATYQEASQVVRKAIGNIPSSRVHAGIGLISENGAISAYVSYNGRVWRGCPQNWVSGMVPLYDPR